LLKKLKPKSEFSRNVLTLMTGTTIAQAIPIAISPILTRIYTPEDFGVFALFLAIVGFFSSVASLRYEQAILIPKRDEDAINIFALGFIIVLLISLSLLFVIILFNDNFVNYLNNEAISNWLYLIPITVFIIGIFNLLILFNNRKKKYQIISNATVLKSIVLATVQISVGFLKTGVDGLIIGQVVSQFFANIKLIKSILKDKILLSKIDRFKMITLAKKYANFPKFQVPHTMLNTFSSNLPIYIFTPFFGALMVGLYSLSTRIVFTPLMIIAGASAKVYSQNITTLYSQKQDTYYFTIHFIKSLFIKIIIPYVIFIIFAPEIFGFVFGERWTEAGIYSQILSPWMFLNVLVSTVSFIPSLVNKQKKAFFVSILQLFLTIIAIVIGVLNNSIYMSLVFFCILNSLVLIYNLRWMIYALKAEN